MNLKQTPFLKIKTIKIDIRAISDSGVGSSDDYKISKSQILPKASLWENPTSNEGGVVLKSTVQLRKSPHRMTQRLIHWAKKTPDKVFIGQKDSKGNWRTLTYAQTMFDTIFR